MARLRVESQVRDLADSHQLVLTPDQRAAITDWDSGRALVLRLVAERDAAGAGLPRIPAPLGSARVTRDAADKIRGAGLAGLQRLGGIQQPAAEEAAHVREQWRHPIQSVHTLVRHSLAEAGQADALTWERHQIAAFVMEQLPAAKRLAMQLGMGQRAANHDAGMFPLLLASALTKVLQNGFENGAAVTYDQWCDLRQVPDFKTNKHTGLAVGNLSQTAANHAFPELTMEDAGYDSTLAMWGATVSLTFQAIINDDLGAFMRQVSRAGSIARRTIDKEVYRALLNATWTHDVTTSAGLGTAGNLDKTRSALMKKTDPAGNPMGITPRYLLHGVTTRQKALADCGIVIAPGQTTLAATTIFPIESVWIDSTALYSSANATDYYLTGDPAIFDTVLVETLLGLSGPIVEAFDAGAVAAEKFKIMHPFAATVATHSDGTNTRISGLQKATA